MEKEYRYMIWNDLKKEYQFANICETTEKGAIKRLFNTIGNDARKYRFVVKKIEKERAIEIRRKLKYKAIAKRIHREIPNTSYELIYDLVIKNYEGIGEIEK